MDRKEGTAIRILAEGVKRAAALAASGERGDGQTLSDWVREATMCYSNTMDPDHPAASMAADWVEVVEFSRHGVVVDDAILSPTEALILFSATILYYAGASLG